MTVNVKERSPSAESSVLAFFQISDLWGISIPQQMSLLGSPSRDTLYKWKNGDVRRLGHDTLQRISYILGIFKALQFGPVLSADWVRCSNRAFGGQSALDRMLGGDIADLAVVRNYLDGI